MKKLLIVAAGLAFAAPALAQQAQTPPNSLPPAWTPLPEQSIPSANRNGIRDFVVSADDLVFLYGANGRWYRVTLNGPCFNIKQRPTIGYQTTATGTFDNSSALLVNGKRCDVQSVVDAPEGPLRR